MDQLCKDYAKLLRRIETHVWIEAEVAAPKSLTAGISELKETNQTDGCINEAFVGHFAKIFIFSFSLLMHELVRNLNSDSPPNFQ